MTRGVVPLSEKASHPGSTQCGSWRGSNQSALPIERDVEQ